MRVIAIDGPSGSGKSTVARALARRLGLDYLDTGAMYRSVAFAALQRGVDPAGDDDVADIARQMDLAMADGNVVVDGVDATDAIRGPEVTAAVSLVAANRRVREEMRRRQRAWAATRGGGVVEGRDIGSVVFPDAVLKVWLTARLDVRAGRRHAELASLADDPGAVAADLARRDLLDRTRDDSPAVASPDAVVVDTTDRSVESIVDDLLARLP